MKYFTWKTSRFQFSIFCSFAQQNHGKMKVIAPIWSGNYRIEFAYTEKATGEHNGKKQDEIRKMTTYLITLK